ncbi:MAG: hypothetical protein HC898_04255 [Phycisphaerales bacterium]|nr:hypothetical protein [Phycisphaerales bacterium]
MQLIYTGRQVELTQQGKDLVSHPTGLTHHPDYGTFLGDTVAGKGVIYHIDWQRLWADGNLNHAVLHVVHDDAAINGTRPEFVTYQGKVCIATSDYGDKDNAVRLYDPVKLKTARRTTEPGVMVQSMPCGAFVQSLLWDEHDQLLVLVQKYDPGLGWRLTGLKLEGPELKGQSPLRLFAPFDDFSPADELEGFHLLPGTGRNLGVFLTSHKQSNVWLGSVKLP